MTNSNPSINPANLDTLTGLIQFGFDKLQAAVNGQLPVQVIAFDRAANRVQVQHLIMQRKTDETIVDRGQIASVPVFQLGGGGFVLKFNIETGDLGWIKASDRDISIFLQEYKISPPQTNRMYNFSDGVFWPDKMQDFTIAEEDEENCVLQSLDGSVKISLGLDRIKFKAPAFIFDGPVTVANDLTVEGSIAAQGGMTTSGGGSTTSTMTGDLRVIGNITASGDITAHVPLFFRLLNAFKRRFR